MGLRDVWKVEVKVRSQDGRSHRISNDVGESDLDSLVAEMNRKIASTSKKVRRVSARGALLPSRGQAWNHAHIFLIGRWNVRMERGGGSGRRRLGGLVHVH